MTTQDNAIKYVERAIEKGDLVRPNRCELCGKETCKNGRIQPIVAHHWNGYDHPLDIWFICRSCNRFLLVHDGNLNLEQAKRYIKEKQKRLLFRYGR